MSLSVASLHIHPIKSLGGFSTGQAQLSDRGFTNDRRWMLVDVNGRCVTQREVKEMACLHCSPTALGFRVTDLRNGDVLDLPWTLESGEERQVTIWSDTVMLRLAPIAWSYWFTKRLGQAVLLMYMPEDSHRPVDPRYAEGITSLSDGYPYLIISQASLDDLNARLDAPLPMDRFRPNIVIAGGEAFQEDRWKRITIGSVPFHLVKPCARCAVPTTDQRTGERGIEPTRTLATFRLTRGSLGDAKVEFGMNAVAAGSGTVRVGDLVAV